MVDKPPSRNPKSGTAPAAGHGTAEASVGGAQTGAGVATPAQSSEPADEYLGKTFGKYRVTKRLGNGGMAVVYLADDLVMKRQVAIKFLSSMFFHKPAAIERFMREAQVAGRLNHPNIIAIHDVSREEHACYIVMELLSPGSAGQHLKHKGPYYWVVATRIIADCCAALKVAHDAGVIHRDIKPDERLTVWDARWRCRASTLERGKLFGAGTPSVGLSSDESPLFSFPDTRFAAILGALMLQAGIVGLPNVGKSTLFNAVTRTRKAEAANYPFCTIEPNQGVVVVPDERLAVLSKLSGSKKLVPAAIEFVDIAGLVKGASKGEGLGNKFLSHIREVDAIVHVVRCFESGDITHVDGTVDPIRDIEVINTELILADLEAVTRRKERSEKRAKQNDKDAKAEYALCEKLLPHLDAMKPAITLELSDEERKLLKSFFLLSAKPCIYACNVAESELAAAAKDPDKHPLVSRVREYVKHAHAASACVVSAAIEAELGELPEEDAKAYLTDLGVEDSGVNLLIKSVYSLLGLQTYLTTGEKETRAWTITKGMKAPQAAGVIHGDFERGFIAAQIVHYDDLVAFGSEAKAREAGKLRIEGKEYVMRDGDVVEWRFNV